MSCFFSDNSDEISILFKKNTSINNIYNILLNLLKNSKKKDLIWFKIFHEIFFKKKLNINNAKYIILPTNVNIELLNKIKKIFPKIKIIIQNFNLNLIPSA